MMESNKIFAKRNDDKYEFIEWTGDELDLIKIEYFLANHHPHEDIFIDIIGRKNILYFQLERNSGQVQQFFVKKGSYIFASKNQFGIMSKRYFDTNFVGLKEELEGE